jgi:hypothetical protein
MSAKPPALIAAAIPPDVIAELIADTRIRRDLGVTKMTFYRWDRDQRMVAIGWPPAIRIGRRKYRDRAAYEGFKSRLARESIARRRELIEQQQKASAG